LNFWKFILLFSSCPLFNQQKLFIFTVFPPIQAIVSVNLMVAMFRSFIDNTFFHPNCSPKAKLKDCKLLCFKFKIILIKLVSFCWTSSSEYLTNYNIYDLGFKEPFSQVDFVYWWDFVRYTCLPFKENFECVTMIQSSFVQLFLMKNCFMNT